MQYYLANLNNALDMNNLEWNIVLRDNSCHNQLAIVSNYNDIERVRFIILDTKYTVNNTNPITRNEEVTMSVLCADLF